MRPLSWNRNRLLEKTASFVFIIEGTGVFVWSLLSTTRPRLSSYTTALIGDPGSLLHSPAVTETGSDSKNTWRLCTSKLVHDLLLQVSFICILHIIHRWAINVLLVQVGHISQRLVECFWSVPHLGCPFFRHSHKTRGFCNNIGLLSWTKVISLPC